MPPSLSRLLRGCISVLISLGNIILLSLAMQVPPPPSLSRADTPSPLRTLDSRHKSSTVNWKSMRAFVSAPVPAGIFSLPDGRAKVAQQIPQRQKIALISTTCAFASLAAIIAFAWLVFGYHMSNAMSVYMPTRIHAINVRPTILLIPVTLSVAVSFCAIGPILYLSSFLHAYYLVRQVDEGRLCLLTRSEAGLLVELLAGGFVPVLRGMKTCFPRGRRTNAVIKFASMLSTVLFFNCLVLLAMDIALHMSIKTIEIQAPTTGMHQANMWGRALITDCLKSSISRNDSMFQTNLGAQNCPVHLGVFSGDEEATLTAKKLSATNRVTVSDDVALLVDARSAANSSFTASTFGLTSRCTPIGQNCQLDGDGLTFLCPKFGFTGTFTKPFVLATTNDSSISRGAISFLIAANFRGTQDSFKNFAEESGAIVSRRNGSLLTILECASQFSQWQYIHTPGVTRALKSEDLALPLIELLLSPMIPGMIQGYSGFGLDLLAEGMATASKNASSLAQLADSFATVFSRIAMAPVAPMTREIPVDSDLAPYQLTIVPLRLAGVVMMFSSLVTILALVFGIGAYMSCSKPGVLYYQWELSMVEMTRQFFIPMDRPATAQGEQDPNHVAKETAGADIAV